MINSATIKTTTENVFPYEESVTKIFLKLNLSIDNNSKNKDEQIYTKKGNIKAKKLLLEKYVINKDKQAINPETTKVNTIYKISYNIG